MSIKDKMLEEAASSYNFLPTDCELLRHNENMTYKVNKKGRLYLLRIHQPVEGFHLDLIRLNIDRVRQIEDEMRLLNFLAENSDLGTQIPVGNNRGEFVTILGNNVPATLLEWVDGETLENVVITDDVAYRTGAMIGKLHNVTGRFHLLNRYKYNGILLDKMLNECSKAEQKAHFTNWQAKVIRTTLEKMSDYFAADHRDSVLVHSDLSKSNMLTCGKKIIPIDFSLSGYSLAEMDLASASSHINDAALNVALMKGYQSVCRRMVDPKGVDVCICFQILLFVICQHDAVADESWFSKKLDKWCEDYFVPLYSD